jgi:hypothetical protein
VSPGLTPVIASLLCLALVGPWVDRDRIVYEIAGGMMLVGIGLWVITWFINRGFKAKRTGFRDIEHMDD